MTPEPLTCDKCGAKMRIETDDAEFMEDRKEAFIKKHEGCLKKVR